MEKECKKSEWDIKLKSKRKPRFKAGADLTDKVNLIAVDIIEEMNEDSLTTDIKMEVEQTKDDRLQIAVKKEVRFKAGADLTEKVNRMSIDLDEDSDEKSTDSKLKVKLETQENERLEISCKKKVQFKAGAELTDKVNKVDVDWIEELIEDKEILTVSFKITSTICQNIEVLELQK